MHLFSLALTIRSLVVLLLTCPNPTLEATDMPHPPARSKSAPLFDTPLDPSDLIVDRGSKPLAKPRPPEPVLPVPTRRHAAWADERLRIWQAMLRVNLPWRRREAFRTCGSTFWLMRHRQDASRFRLAADHCNDRFCRPCQFRRSLTIRKQLDGQLRNERHRLMTLTLRHTDDSLGVRVDWLLRSFRRLRQTAAWRRVVTGGIAFVEVTFNAGDEQWHPHLHCVLTGRYIPITQIREAWRRATAGSHVVDVRLVRSAKEVSRYVAKYATKAMKITDDMPDWAVDQTIEGLRGRRTLITFGQMHGVKTRPQKERGEWECICHENEVLDTAALDEELRFAVITWIKMVHDRVAQPEMTHKTDRGP